MRRAALLALLGAVLFGASAAAAPIPIIRDGIWAGKSGRGLVIVHVQSHRVTYLRFMATLDCHLSDTGEDYERAFTAGRRFGTRTIPRSGLLFVRWTETDAGRQGDIAAELDWRGRRYPLLASFSVDVPRRGDSLEDCNGFIAVPARRGGPVPPPTP